MRPRVPLRLMLWCVYSHRGHVWLQETSLWEKFQPGYWAAGAVCLLPQFSGSVRDLEIEDIVCCKNKKTH